jgi:hypothetical protein
MMERMTNDAPRDAAAGPSPRGSRWSDLVRPGYLLDQQIGSAIFWAPVAWLLLLLWTSLGGPRTWLPFLPLAWFGQSLFFAPFIVWLAWRADHLSPARTAAVLAAGAAPGLFFFPIGPASEAPVVWAALPALIAWGVGADYVAFHPLPASRPWRTALAAAGALACLGAALWAAALLVAYWPSVHDGRFEQNLAWTLCGLCALALAGFGWAGLRLLRGAIRA